MAIVKETDAVTGTETTGHEWDGIKELNTPLPRWWLWVLYASIIWAIGYWIAMPAWPLISTHTKGLLGYSSRASVIADIKQATEAQSGMTAKVSASSLETIRTDPQLLEFALAGGRSAFNVNCTQCHGSGAQGAPGYPNLNDDEWLWGGKLEDIATTITHGIRHEADDDTRVSDMPAYLTDEVLTAVQIDEVTEYVLSLSGKAEDQGRAAKGKVHFTEHCVACHKADGSGNPELGAPPLNNDLWLYGGERADIKRTISLSRNGVMPAWGPLLQPATIKKLSIYIHSLGGGQ